MKLKIILIKPRRAIYLLLTMLLILTNTQVNAGSTKMLGATTGPHNFTYSCRSGERIAGAKVFFDYEGAIDLIGFKCVSISHEGLWSTTSPANYWIGTSQSSNHKWTQQALCPKDHFVSGIKANIKSGSGFLPINMASLVGLKTINGIELTCSVANQEGKREGLGYGIFLVANSSPIRGINVTESSNCPNKELAISSNGWKGLLPIPTPTSIGAKQFLAGIKLGCRSGTPGAVFNNSPAKIISPKVSSSDKFRATGQNQKFTFTKTPNSSSLDIHYDICLRAISSFNCLYSNSYKSTSGSGDMTVSLIIPQSLQGKTLEWSVKTCSNKKNKCGAASRAETFKVIPNSTKPKYPIKKSTPLLKSTTTKNKSPAKITTKT